jgi:bleomycin hydrolase
MNKFLTLKLRQFACELRESGTAGESALRVRKDRMIGEIYHMLCVSLGKPPESVTFEARDKNKKFLRIGPVSPVEFFEKAVGWDLSDYVSLINSPTADKPYYRMYTVDFLGNVAEGQPIRYLNVPSEELKAAVVAQLKDNTPVWFGCDVGQWLDRDKGAMYLSGLDFPGVFGAEFPMTKAERLDYGESRMTHAMVFYGVNIGDSGKIDRFKVANTGGDDKGQDGWYMMEDAWFDEYLYQALIHKKYLTERQLAALSEEPVHLNPWTPWARSRLLNNKLFKPKRTGTRVPGPSAHPQSAFPHIPPVFCISIMEVNYLGGYVMETQKIAISCECAPVVATDRAEAKGVLTPPPECRRWSGCSP